MTLHLAPPATSTSPEPMMSTSAVPLECAFTPPEPAIDTERLCVWTAPASMSPDPAMSYFADCALPAPAFTPPEPAIDSLSCWTSIAATSIPPDPATLPSKFRPATLSTRMSPEPAIVAPLSCGTVTVKLALPRLPQPQLKKPCWRSGRMTSLSPSTSTTVRSSNFSPPRAETLAFEPVRTSTS